MVAGDPDELTKLRGCIRIDSGYYEYWANCSNCGDPALFTHERVMCVIKQLSKALQPCVACHNGKDLKLRQAPLFCGLCGRTRANVKQVEP
jgi:hypothetical protein